MDKTKLVGRGLRLLARREHSRHELFIKLQKCSSDLELINEALDYLVQAKYQDDNRFIESYVRDSINSGYGPIRIKYKLIQKGITADQVKEHLANLDINWKELAAALIKRKFANKDLTDRSVLAKAYNFLRGRGFEWNDSFVDINVI